ncbi:hypothetical protein [Phenylobacterium sp.]|uniref:hypothetical protein n=1 Tax=Phenylobacterium sp. TaxID=1871053 RepID=UPI002735AED8|nr:hypothetical protein [Phenylobacterium sp.]MDP3632199.1 hypothetical protein [Phenylobacterium sp.]
MPLAGRTCNLNTQDNVDLVDALKGLFNDKTNLSKQYREGFMGRTAGFDFMENTLWPSHTVPSRCPLRLQDPAAAARVPPGQQLGRPAGPSPVAAPPRS